MIMNDFQYRIAKILAEKFEVAIHERMADTTPQPTQIHTIDDMRNQLEILLNEIATYEQAQDGNVTND